MRNQPKIHILLVIDSLSVFKFLKNSDGYKWKKFSKKEVDV